jgi:hypothetical protein
VINTGAGAGEYRGLAPGSRSVTLGSNAAFEGKIFANKSTTLGTNAVDKCGPILTQVALVTLADNDKVGISCTGAGEQTGSNGWCGGGTITNGAVTPLPPAASLRGPRRTCAEPRKCFPDVGRYFYMQSFARRDRAGCATAKSSEHAARPAHEAPACMNWARLLKRVFDIDLEHCPQCGGDLKVIAAIEVPAVIAKIRVVVLKKMEAVVRTPGFI